MTAVAFVLAAGLGAALRHRVNVLGHGWLGTLGVNVVGAFGLGWLGAADVSSGVVTVLGTGFCGALTTFSTFSLEATSGPPDRRIAIISATLVLGLAAAVAGHALG